MDAQLELLELNMTCTTGLLARDALALLLVMRNSVYEQNCCNKSGSLQQDLGALQDTAA